MDITNNILEKTISSNNAISFSETSENTPSTTEKDDNTVELYYSNDEFEPDVEESLPYQIYNYVYNKKPDFALMHTPFWEAFKAHHPIISLPPIELKIYFFENVLPRYQQATYLTFYQTKYFDTLSNLYKNIDINQLRVNDPVSGVHYHRADDNDTFLDLINRSDVNIIGVTENVNYDIHSDDNRKHLFQMSDPMKLCYSAFLRNAEEIENKVLLEHHEILKRLRVFFAEDKILPTISEIKEILKKTDDPRDMSTSSELMSYRKTSLQSSTDMSHAKTSSQLISQSPNTARAALGRYFDQISMVKPTKVRKPKRDTKTLRKMRDSLRNPKLKEFERKAKAAKQRFRKYLN